MAGNTVRRSEALGRYTGHTKRYGRLGGLTERCSRLRAAMGQFALPRAELAIMWSRFYVARSAILCRLALRGLRGVRSFCYSGLRCIVFLFRVPIQCAATWVLVALNHGRGHRFRIMTLPVRKYPARLRHSFCTLI